MPPEVVWPTKAVCNVAYELACATAYAYCASALLVLSVWSAPALVALT